MSAKNKKINRVSEKDLIHLIASKDQDGLLAIDENCLGKRVLLVKYPESEWDEKVIAQRMVDLGYRFTKREFLEMVIDKDEGFTLAHYMAEKEMWFDPDKDRDIVLLQSYKNWTVAHSMALSGYVFDPDKYRDIVKLQGDFGWRSDAWFYGTGVSIAHLMAKKGYMFDPDRHRDILELRDGDGNTVAHVMAENKYIFDPAKHTDILKWKNRHGETVAHYMIRRGYRFDLRKYNEVLDDDLRYYIATEMDILLDPCKYKKEFGWGDELIDDILRTFILRKKELIYDGRYDNELLALSDESLQRYTEIAEAMHRNRTIFESEYKKAMQHLKGLLKAKRDRRELRDILEDTGIRM